VQEVRSHFKEKVFDTVIPRNVKLSESPSHGKPIILYDISSSGSQSYLALAKELIQKLELKPTVVVGDNEEGLEPTLVGQQPREAGEGIEHGIT